MMSVAFSLPSSCISIPPELVYHILEHIQSDDTSATLLNCVLVSRSWASVAQRHLFSSVTVQGLDDRNLSSFLRHLSKFPSIGPYVERLTIHNGTCGLSELLAVVSKLTSLRHLMIESMSVTALDSVPSPALLTRSLDTLKVWASTIHHGHSSTPWSPLFDLINTFSSIGNLRLDILWDVELQHDAVSSPFSRKTHVDSLFFFPTHSDSETVFVKEVLRSIDMENLVSLELEMYPGRVAYHQALIDAATGLKTCVIIFGSDVGDQSFKSQQLSLFPCKSLEAVHFTLFHLDLLSYPTTNDFSAQWTHSLVLLSSLSHPSPLSKIRFDIRVGRNRFTRPEDLKIRWYELEQALVRFRSLNTLDIRLYVPLPHPDSLAFITDELAGVARRCLLKVVWNVAK